jgi:8-oxo-dGTP pyrophosphatase MutT (NUDIX family)
MEKKKKVRNSAKAVIIRDGKLLVIIKRDQDGAYAVLPGGGQDWGETLPDAITRECLEEIGTEVKVRKLLFIREYRSDRHEFAETSPDVHQVEFYFKCKVSKHYEPSQGHLPDNGQEEVRWVSLDKLDDIHLYPRTICSVLTDLKHSVYPFYLGDCN